MPDSQQRGFLRGLFGWETFFQWDVFGALVPGVFLAAGLAMLGVDWFPHNLLISQLCLSVAALLAVIKTIGHAVKSSASLVERVIVAAMLASLFICADVYTAISIQRHKEKPESEAKVIPVVPHLDWDSPNPIVEGEALTAKQLDARSPVPGEFVYNPVLGATLAAGTNTLSVTFYPSDRNKYLDGTKTVALVVMAKRQSSHCLA